MQDVQRFQLAVSETVDFVFFFDHNKEGHAYSRVTVGSIKPLELVASACCFKLPKGASAVVDVYRPEGGMSHAFDCRIENCTDHTPLRKAHFNNLIEMAPVFNSVPAATAALIASGGPISQFCTFGPGANKCGDGKSSIPCPPGLAPPTYKAGCVGNNIACVQAEPPKD